MRKLFWRHMPHTHHADQETDFLVQWRKNRNNNKQWRKANRQANWAILGYMLFTLLIVAALIAVIVGTLTNG